MHSTLVYILLIKLVNSHGWLDEPVARSSAWLYNKKFENAFPNNYMHIQMNCGGYDVLLKNDLKCGICGEEFNKIPKEFEKDGEMYIGKVVQNYFQGQIINVTVQITANHLGYSEFLICNVDNLTTDATQECLNKRILKDSNGTSKFYIQPYYRGPITTSLVLPLDLKCNHCVFQWRWNTGNRWGTDPITGESCLGCGAQEQFYGCSDIRILGEGEIIPNDNGNKNPIHVTLYGQCGGKFYSGYTTCVNGATCYVMSDWYSQCLTSCPSDWECNTNNTSNVTSTSTKLILSSISASNTGVSITTSTSRTYSSSKAYTSLLTVNTFSTSIESNTISIYGQCGGLEYIGPTTCVNGTNCYVKSKWYSQCSTSCPSDWECNTNNTIVIINSTTTDITSNLSKKNSYASLSTAFVKSNTELIYIQCGGLEYTGHTKCANGTKCYVKSEWYSQCLPSCPSNWDCDTNKTTFETKISALIFNNYVRNDTFYTSNITNPNIKTTINASKVFKIENSSFKASNIDKK